MSNDEQLGCSTPAPFTSAYFAAVSQWAKVSWIIKGMATSAIPMETMTHMLGQLLATPVIPQWLLCEATVDTQAAVNEEESNCVANDDDVTIASTCCSRSTSWDESLRGLAVRGEIYRLSDELSNRLHEVTCPWHSQGKRLLSGSSILLAMQCTPWFDHGDVHHNGVAALPMAADRNALELTAQSMMKLLLPGLDEPSPNVVLATGDHVDLRSRLMVPTNVFRLLVSFGLMLSQSRTDLPWSWKPSAGEGICQGSLTSLPASVRRILGGGTHDLASPDCMECRYCGAIVNAVHSSNSESSGENSATPEAEKEEDATSTNQASQRSKDHTVWRIHSSFHLAHCEWQRRLMATLSKGKGAAVDANPSVIAEFSSRDDNSIRFEFTDSDALITSLVALWEPATTGCPSIDLPFWKVTKSSAIASAVVCTSVPSCAAATSTMLPDASEVVRIHRLVQSPASEVLRVALAHRAAGAVQPTPANKPWVDTYMRLRNAALAVSRKRQRGDVADETGDGEEEKERPHTQLREAVDVVQQQLVNIASVGARGLVTKTHRCEVSETVALDVLKRACFSSPGGALDDTAARKKLEAYLTAVKKAVADSQVVIVAPTPAPAKKTMTAPVPSTTQPAPRSMSAQQQHQHHHVPPPPALFQPPPPSSVVVGKQPPPMMMTGGPMVGRPGPALTAFPLHHHHHHHHHLTAPPPAPSLWSAPPTPPYAATSPSPPVGALFDAPPAGFASPPRKPGDSGSILHQPNIQAPAAPPSSYPAKGKQLSTPTPSAAKQLIAPSATPGKTQPPQPLHRQDPAVSFPPKTTPGKQQPAAPQGNYINGKKAAPVAPAKQPPLQQAPPKQAPGKHPQQKHPPSQGGRGGNRGGRGGR